MIRYVSQAGEQTCKGREGLGRLTGLREAPPLGCAEAMSSHGLLWSMLIWCFPVTGQSAGNRVRPLEAGAGLKPQGEKKKRRGRQ